MPLYKPSELSAFLQSLGISPKKGLSQNFLLDQNIINKIITTAAIKPDDCILEIGPGPGAITEILLEQHAHVIAVEKDAVLAKELNRFKQPEHHLEVFCQDILDFSLEKHLSPRKKTKVIANLPFHITTPILSQFLPHYHLISKIVVIIQDEVARRFTAHPGSKDYSSITVFLNFYAKTTYAFTVSRNCFFPKPKVDSAVVVLDLKKPPQVEDIDAFFTLTRTAFKQRRKMLRSSLRELYPPEQITAALESLSLNPQARPEELSLDNFLALFHILT